LSHGPRPGGILSYSHGRRGLSSWLLPIVLVIGFGIAGLAGASAHGVPIPSALGSNASVGAGTNSGVWFGSSWYVTTWVNYSWVSITVVGNVVVEPGGHLTIANSTLTVDESWNLEYGVAVDSGGSLTLTDTDVQSSPYYDHTYLRTSPGATLHIQGGELQDIGGNAGTEQGLFINSNGASVSGTTFNNYYQAIVVSSATNVHLTAVRILDSTTWSDVTYAVYVFGTSSGFVLTDSTFDIPEDVGAVDVMSPYAQVSNNNFELYSSGAGLSALLFGYADNGAQNANHSSFTNNTVTGSGFIDEAGSYVTIWGNSIHDTGYDRPYGIMAEVPLWTQKGLWVEHLTIEWNTISDYSRYGIRLQQNVSNFVVAHNTIVAPSTDPGPSWTEVWGGPQTDAIYLIRGVQDGTVQSNYIDDSDTWYIATNGITLESDVSDVRVLDNQLYNVSQEAIVLQGNVPGFDNALPWQDGPSSYDTIANNLFDNERTVWETNFTVEAILQWQWANHSTIVNNTFIGWENVPTNHYFNGAIVLTTASYGFYYNNTVEGARYGFVFTNFTGVAHPHSGEFNRSYNLVYGNFLSGITVAAVDETSTDGMGPLHNVIVVLSNPSTGAGEPTSYVESIGNAQTISTTESGSCDTEVLRTASPIFGGVQNFTTWVDWSNDKFSVSASGGVGAGVLTFTPTSVSTTTVGFSISAAWATNATVNLYPTGGSYTAHYNVTTKLNGVTSSYLATANGPLTVAVAKGVTAVTIRLVSYTQNAVTEYALSGEVMVNSSATAVPGAAVTIVGGPATVSNATGGFEFYLPNGSYALRVTAPGLAPAMTVVSIAGADAHENIALARVLYSVSGDVIYGANQTPVPGAVVQVLGGASTTSNATGAFSLQLANGTYQLEVSAAGVPPVVLNVSVAGVPLVLDVPLSITRSGTPPGGSSPVAASTGARSELTLGVAIGAAAAGAVGVFAVWRVRLRPPVRRRPNAPR
jgi:hypothetical protein